MYYRIFSKIYEMGAKQMCKDCQNFIEKGSKILDLGCGSGIAAENFQDFFDAKVIGADIKDNRVLDIPFRIIDGGNLPFRNLFFDIVLINYVLHHAQDPERLLKEAKRVSKKIIIYEDLPEGILSKLR
ncbi:class I SAM-dependent methyltransferase, partial [Patescibacteria group bacterium]|nr:class I SAM-dependent methyltransferase [Patescibacteria group bacterium]